MYIYSIKPFLMFFSLISSILFCIAFFSHFTNLKKTIFRDYMNGLEYVIHSFDHLKNHNQ